MSYSIKNVPPYQYNEVAVHGYITVLRRVLIICVVVLLVGSRMRRSIGVSNFGIEELSLADVRKDQTILPVNHVTLTRCASPPRCLSGARSLFTLLYMP